MLVTSIRAGALLAACLILGMSHARADKVPSKVDVENANAEPAAAEPATADEGDDFGDDDDWGDVEEVEEVQEAAVATPDEEPKGMVAVLGYFHAAMVHMPIAWLILLVLLDILTFLRGVDYSKGGYLVLLLSIISFIPAIASGLARLEGFAEPSEQALLHRNVMFAAVPLLVVAAYLRHRSGNKLLGTAQHAYLGLILVSAALVFFGAHEGGEMVYGEAPF